MENYTDKEIFDLWKTLIKDKENSESVNDSLTREIGRVGDELVKRGYMLTEEEYNAIDYYLQESKLYNSGFWVCQENWGEDYFHDDDNEENLTLKEGLQVIYGSMVLEYVSEYPTEIKNGLKKAIKRFLDIDLEV